MGAGIALAFLNAGIPVTIVETTQEALDRGVDRIARTTSHRQARRASPSAGRRPLGQADTPSLTFEDLGKADLIIEAVFENMALKKEIFAKLDNIAKSGAIIATNTSTLDVDEIAAVPSGRRTWSACTSSRPPTSCGCWRSCAPRRPPTT